VQTLDYSAAAIAPQIDRSLQRMKTDYIDIMQLHSPTYDDVAHGDGREGLKRAQEQGKVRFVSVPADDEAARKAIEIGECDTLQLTYNVLQPEPAEIIAAAREKDMGIIDQGPIANATYEAPRPDDDGAPAWDRPASCCLPETSATWLEWKRASDGCSATRRFIPRSLAPPTSATSKPTSTAPQTTCSPLSLSS